MRRGDVDHRDEGGAGQVTAWSWTDPQALAANAAGVMTPGQRVLIVGPRVRPPYGAWVLLVALAALEGAAGVLGATPKHGMVPGGGLAGVVGTMVFMMVVLGWQLLVVALVSAVPRWADRHLRRRIIAGLTDYRVGSAVGQVIAGLTVEAQAWVGRYRILLPLGAPALPPPGTYRLYWLEPVAGAPGALLLSAQPMDAQQSTTPPQHGPTSSRTPPGGDREPPIWPLPQG